jgi:signal transduction histidine kinase
LNPRTGHRDGSALHRLTADVARLCHVREAVLSCGTQVVARWAADEQQGPRHVVATQPFGAGVEAYELNLFDQRPRALTAEETGAFQALTGAIQQQLEIEPAVTTPPDAGWVKDHLSVALDYVTDSFILVMGDWTIQHVNTCFERIVKRPRTHLVGRVLWEAIPELVGTTFEAECRRTAVGAVPRVFEEFSAALGGRWFQSRAFPCKEGLAVLSIDISDRKIDEITRVGMEQKLLQAQRMEALGTLAGGIAHDFNNILGAILGYAELAHAQAEPGSTLQQHLDGVMGAGLRAKSLVQRILAFSRSGMGERQPVHVGALVDEALDLLAATVPSGVRLQRDLRVGDAALLGDPAQIHQVVMNLGTNALQASRAPGVVAVTLAPRTLATPRRATSGNLPPGDYLELVVRDEGTGIERGQIERIFDPFFTTKASGTGLGLAVVKRVMALHGGEVTLGPFEAGATFALHLPLRRP